MTHRRPPRNNIHPQTTGSVEQRTASSRHATSLIGVASGLLRGGIQPTNLSLTSPGGGSFAAQRRLLLEQLEPLRSDFQEA